MTQRYNGRHYVTLLNMLTTSGLSNLLHVVISLPDAKSCDELLFCFHFQVDPKDFAEKIYNWMKHGFRELGDYAGLGIGSTTDSVLNNPQFREDPHMVRIYSVTSML